MRAVRLRVISTAANARGTPPLMLQCSLPLVDLHQCQWQLPPRSYRTHKNVCNRGEGDMWVSLALILPYWVTAYWQGLRHLLSQTQTWSGGTWDIIRGKRGDSRMVEHYRCTIMWSGWSHATRINHRAVHGEQLDIAINESVADLGLEEQWRLWPVAAVARGSMTNRDGDGTDSLLCTLPHGESPSCFGPMPRCASTHSSSWLQAELCPTIVWNQANTTTLGLSNKAHPRLAPARKHHTHVNRVPPCMSIAQPIVALLPFETRARESREVS